MKYFKDKKLGRFFFLLCLKNHPPEVQVDVMINVGSWQFCHPETSKASGHLRAEVFA